MQLLEGLHEAGVEYIFANLGSDHPAIIEAIAEAQVLGKPLPRLVTCPNEMVALSIAHGYAQSGGRPQCVLVHVECGTQALAGAVHNAARGRIPVVIVAGASPFTQEGELRGSRNEFIQWIQDVHDQRGIVRGYMRYETEIRSGRNIKQILARSLQFATSEPRGPVYLMAAREVLEEEVPPVTLDASRWHPTAPAALPAEDAAEIARALAAARNPLIVTSYLGRNPSAVPALVRLAERLAIGVHDSVPSAMNFPADNTLYQGCQWNEPVQNAALAEADLVLVLDSDVPWIASHNRPRTDARILHIDTDVLKQAMPLWYIHAHRAWQANAAQALAQIERALDTIALDDAAIEARRRRLAARHAERLRHLLAAEKPSAGDITPQHLTGALRARADADTIVLSEGISNYTIIADHMMRTRPGTIHASGGGSLGWNGGAAIGAKLAHPDATVMALGGDGSYMFSVPSTVHWMARQYETPFLQVVYNNRGWKSPKLSMLGVHPHGHASRANDIGVAFDPPPDYAGIAAAAGGAFARTVKRPEELDAALDDAMHAIRVEKRAAVLDVWLAPL
jgi:acetolactate synthase-1/2/3 large subunit